MKNDGFVVWICDGEGCEEWRPVVCQVSWIQIDDVGTGIVGGIVDVMLEHHQVDGSGWKSVEGLELVHVKVAEVGSCCVGYWIRPCSSSAASSLQG